MMGRREVGQGQFFYSFDLDKVVPPDHLVRQIDGVLDLGWVHRELASYYSHTGRPSIDPALMIRMLIVGYVFAIRSERQLCSEVQVNLAYRWFCKLGIEDRIPDHSVFSRARHDRFRESDALRRVFEGVVATCAALDSAQSSGRDDARSDNGPSGGARHKPPKEVSLTDPQAAWVARKSIDPFFAYDANYLIDNKAGIIVDAEATRANRSDEIAVTQTMVDRVQQRFHVQPQRLAGDTAYGAVRLLKWLVDRQIAPHTPVWDKSVRPDGLFSRAEFSFDKERNVYTCPGGAKLTSTGNVDQGHIIYYRARLSDCASCALKSRCTTGPVRKVSHDLDEDVREYVRALANTEAFQRSR